MFAYSAGSHPDKRPQLCPEAHVLQMIQTLRLGPILSLQKTLELLLLLRIHLCRHASTSAVTEVPHPVMKLSSTRMVTSSSRVEFNKV